MPIYLFRCSWRGTAITIRIPAQHEKEAFIKAQRAVKKMEGGDKCLEITLLQTE